MSAWQARRCTGARVGAAMLAGFALAAGTVACAGGASAVPENHDTHVGLIVDTADGQVRNCLFATTESDLRGPLRAGASDATIAALWRRAVASKLPGHGINDPGFLQPARPMSAIGG